MEPKIKLIAVVAKFLMYQNKKHSTALKEKEFSDNVREIEVMLCSCGWKRLFVKTACGCICPDDSVYVGAACEDFAVPGQAALALLAPGAQHPGQDLGSHRSVLSTCIFLGNICRAVQETSLVLRH